MVANVTNRSVRPPPPALPPPPPPGAPESGVKGAAAPPPSYHARSGPACGTSGDSSSAVELMVPRFLPPKSPTRAARTASTGCSPRSAIASSFSPSRDANGAHSVSSQLTPLSSRSTTERFSVVPPSRLLMMVTAPTLCTTPTTSTVSRTSQLATSARRRKA